MTAFMPPLPPLKSGQLQHQAVPAVSPAARRLDYLQATPMQPMYSTMPMIQVLVKGGRKWCNVNHSGGREDHTEGMHTEAYHVHTE